LNLNQRRSIMTDIYALITQVRDSYVDAFRDFIEEQHRSCRVGASEVKMRLGGPSKLTGGYYCVDFVSNDQDDSDVIEFNIDPYYSFTGLRGQLGDLSVTFTSMRWNDVNIAHDLLDAPTEALTAWFEQWFDPSDRRRDPAAEFSNTIHSLMADQGALSIDFGTAPTEAFWALLNLLEEAGAHSATIRCGE
jgi:hypothetical protein